MLKLLHTTTAILVLVFSILVLVHSGQIEPKLFKFLNEAELRVNIFVSVKGDESLNILRNLGTKFKTTRMGNALKSELVMRELELNSKTTQKSTIDQISEFAKYEGAEIQSFWINNFIFVRGATQNLIKYLSELPQVDKIYEEFQIKLFKSFTKVLNNTGGPCQKSPTWGVKKIGADKVWDMGIVGENVTVGIIDTGVFMSHEALYPNWIGAEFGYFNFKKVEENLRNGILPDPHGHGTHVTGTAVGGKGIGVAPGAKWMGCGLYNRGFDVGLLFQCAEWMFCPYMIMDGGEKVKDCSKAPHIICNSWGLENEMDIFRPMVEAWKTAGIIPVFAAGNSGAKGCGSSNLPAMSMADVISVGNIMEDDRLSDSSSLWPSVGGIQVPDVSAPGTDILSAYHMSQIDYIHMTGTSMAAPHVAGVVALMIGADPQLTFDQIQSILTSTAHKNLTFRNQKCGDVYDNEFPNNHFGYGRVDAYGAVLAVINGDY